MKNKKYLIIIMLLFLLIGCSNNKNFNSNKEGYVLFSTVDQVLDKIDNDESFIVLFTQSSCTSCKKFYTILKSYLLNHHVILYDVTLDSESRSKEETKKLLDKDFPDLMFTPSVYYIKDGKNYSQLKFSDDMEKDFSDWVIKYDLENLND